MLKIKISIELLNKALREALNSYHTEPEDKRMVVFEVQNGILYIRNNGLHMQVVYRVSVSKDETNCRYILPVREISAFINELQRNAATLNIDKVELKFDEKSVVVSGKKIKCPFQLTDTTEIVPSIPIGEEGLSQVSVESTALADLFKRSTFFAAYSVKPLIEYIHFQIKDGRVVVQTLSGVGASSAFVKLVDKSDEEIEKLADDEKEKYHRLKSIDEEFSLHMDILKSLDFQGENVTFMIGKTAFVFTDGEKVVMIKRTDNDFRKSVDSILNSVQKNFDDDFTTIKVSREAFLGAIDLAASIKNKDPKDDTICLEVSKNKLKVFRAKGPSTEVECEVESDTKVTIGLSYKLAKVFALLQPGEINLNFISPLLPVRGYNATSPNAMHIILPKKLNDASDEREESASKDSDTSTTSGEGEN